MLDLAKLTYGYQAIDRNHLHLIQGLLVASKPKKILELGVGTGNVSQICLQAIEYNKNEATLTCVDNWQDWKGTMPKIGSELQKLGANVITQGEKAFVQQHKDEHYDFIISDGAHGASDQWCGTLYDMLNRYGVLIAHDVTNKHFPNLARYKTEARRRRYMYMLFNKSSREDERCERGTLAVWKD